jgi:hypothetical protein
LFGVAVTIPEGNCPSSASSGVKVATDPELIPVKRCWLLLELLFEAKRFAAAVDAALKSKVEVEGVAPTKKLLFLLLTSRSPPFDKVSVKT